MSTGVVKWTLMDDGADKLETVPERVQEEVPEEEVVWRLLSGLHWLHIVHPGVQVKVAEPSIIPEKYLWQKGGFGYIYQKGVIFVWHYSKSKANDHG